MQPGRFGAGGSFTRVHEEIKTHQNANCRSRIISRPRSYSIFPAKEQKVWKTSKKIFPMHPSKEAGENRSLRKFSKTFVSSDPIASTAGAPAVGCFPFFGLISNLEGLGAPAVEICWVSVLFGFFVCQLRASRDSGGPAVGYCLFVCFCLSTSGLGGFWGYSCRVMSHDLDDAHARVSY